MTRSFDVMVRIARTLGIQVEDLAKLYDGPVDHRATLEEFAELFEAFRQIDDGPARRRCLSYVKAEAGRAGDALSIAPQTERW